MTFDLWADTETENKEKIEEKALPVLTVNDGFKAAIQLHGKDIFFASKFNLKDKPEFENFLKVNEHENNNALFNYSVRFNPINSFVMRALLKGIKTEISSTDAKLLSTEADKISVPTVTLSEDKKHVIVTVPGIKAYKDLLVKVNGYPTKEGYKVALTRVLDLEIMANTIKNGFPKIVFSKEVLQLNRDPIVGFDGTLDSLKKIPVSALNVVNSNSQTWKALKKSSKTLEEKMKSFGIESLHDLLFWLPKRYIDKSKPQEIDDLVEGEPATITGVIDYVAELGGGNGVVFQVKTGTGSTIRTTFFRQKWLKIKFKVGDEVLVTGKFSPWKGQPQLNGSSIEHAVEATMLPIVPVYKQSESKGITTYFIMAANRELLSRIDGLELPVYFKQKGRIDYHTALTELHFPSSLKAHFEAVETLAYYELIYMQLIMQEARENSIDKPGISMTRNRDRDLQYSAYKNLPFELTDSQKKAVVEMNKKLSTEVPSTVLLNADVGAGKGLLEDEVILTPKGWKKLKELKKGDKVIGRNGKPTKIIGYYPQGYQEVAKITFSDNSEIITDLEHRWTVMPTNQFPAKYASGHLPEYVISTGEMISEGSINIDIVQQGRFGLITKKTPVKTNFLNSRGNYKWKIPLLSSPVEFEELEKPLPLDPYIFGYWLGDGSSGSLELGVGKDDIENTRSLIKEKWLGYTTESIDKRNDSVSLKLKKEKAYGLNLLRSMNVWRNKHIPDYYLRSSPENRLALLQGLMDSDGSADLKGYASFGNNNKNLIDGVIELVRSLGGRAYISRERYCSYPGPSGEKIVSPNLSYEVIVDMPLGMNPFLLKRKADRYANRVNSRPKKSRSLTRLITNVEKLPNKMKTICIKVEAPDELFITKDYIVTHNTIVSQLACLRAVEAGRQAVILAPTDVLARQLFSTFEKLTKPLLVNGKEVKIGFLSGSMKVAEKKPIIKDVNDGVIDVLIGTHSVMASNVKYNDLGLIIIDEQQKFGAEQRTHLLNSREDNLVPDLLMMSATPIPRSTAQVFYGDIDMIELTEKPPGRKPIVTEWIQENPVDIVNDAVNPIWSDVISEAQKGHQTFIITPLVSESDRVDAASVEKSFEALKNVALSGLRLAFVHGRMKPVEQQEIMKKFREKEFDVLIASTVIEVGVDIPDATRVIILSADRLGASSLHQIRGRVGRNNKASKCYLVSLGKTENSQLRLQSLVDSEDGFDIAKVDLKIRGEGTMFSSDQSGHSGMAFASIEKHSERISEAKEEAIRILRSPFRVIALRDAENKFESNGRLF